MYRQKNLSEERRYLLSSPLYNVIFSMMRIMNIINTVTLINNFQRQKFFIYYVSFEIKLNYKKIFY